MRLDLLEREAELEGLDAATREAGAGRGGVVFLCGEAGIGKTALVSAFAESVRNQFRVLTGRCDPLTTPQPLGPLVDIAPSLDSQFEVLLASGQRPTGIFSEALRLCSAQPTILVFEDVHWADDATFDFLRFAGRRLSTSSTLLVCTFRDDDIGSNRPLQVALGDLWGSTGVRRIDVRPLSPAAVAQMASNSDMDPAGLYARTGGNPFYVTEVLAAGADVIPPTVRDTVMARIARLSGGAQMAVRAAAVSGGRLEVEQLCSTFDIDDDGITECFASGILLDNEGVVEFRHELARAAVLAAIANPTKSKMHSRIVANGRRRGVMPDQLAWMAEQAELAHDPMAVADFAPAAARRASRLGAHREAAAQFRRSLKLGRLTRARRASLIEGLALELTLIGENAEAAALRLQAQRIWRELGHIERAADNVRWRSQSCFRLGKVEEAGQLAIRAVEMLERLPAGRELAWAYGNRAHMCSMSDKYQESMLWADKALEFAGRLGDQELLIFSLNDRGVGRLWLGDQTGVTDLLESIKLAREFGYPEHAARGLLNLAAYYIEHLLPLEGLRLLDEANAGLVDGELADLQRHLSGIKAMARAETGDFAGAIEDAAAARSGPASAVTAAVLGFGVHGRVDAILGNFREAELSFASAMSIGERAFNVRWHVHLLRAEAAWLHGDYRTAQVEVAAAEDSYVGDPEARIVKQLIGFWRSKTRLPLDRPNDDPAREPLILEIQGKWREAAELWKERGCVYRQALAVLEGSDPDLISDALRILERLGARPAARLARQKLRHFGIEVRSRRGPSTATQANAAGLTRREAEIVDLIEIGLTNTKIAERLFLAPKTIEHHVSNLMAKLGAVNRTDAVRLARERLTPAPLPPVGARAGGRIHKPRSPAPRTPPPVGS